MKRCSIKPNRGFTLIELMIVVMIVAIIATIAYSSYSSQTTKTRRTDAQAALMGLAQAMERHKTEDGTYTTAISGTAPKAPDIYPTQSPIDGSNKYYDLLVQSVTDTTYTLRAEPINAQAGDGDIELDSTGARRWDRDDGGFGADDNCWQTSC